MIKLTCPWCGERPHAEFTYGHDATIKRPDDAVGEEKAWFDYVYIRENRKGPHVEYWQHTGGCRQFFKVMRNVVTHEVIKCAPPSEALEKELEQ